MPDFITENESDPSIIGQIHALYKAVTELSVARGGQKTQASPKPFMVYDLIDETKYSRHQVLKKYDGDQVTYKQPHHFIFQYTLVFDSQDSNCAKKTTDLSRYLVSDKFFYEMNKIGVGFFTSLDVSEQNIQLDGFSDRQFVFQIHYFWSDVWTDTDGSSGEIATTEIEQTDVPGNA